MNTQLKKTFDVIVIGGGSGGIACARECAKLGANVAIFDFVKPSPFGSKWGLGGTCVNVGCIPKKLMHYSSILGSKMDHARTLGWNINGNDAVVHKWDKMVEAVQCHLKSLNFGYRVDLMKNKVTYLNSFARFKDRKSIEYEENGVKKELMAEKIVLAVGGRPKFPNIPGAKEFGISSDDIFSLKKSPGKTLIVGASYIALETAGFLTEFGLDVTIAVRSIVLRGFDRQCADRIKEYMKKTGTLFLEQTVPLSLEKTGGKIKVHLKNNEKSFYDFFDTVFFAVGREPSLNGLNVAACGIELLPNGKIAVENEQTSVPGIFAIGDVIDKWELTPVAIQTGILLAGRIMGTSSKKMNYELVPTTVFTPVEYGCVGLSEEEASQKYGKDNIEVYLSSFSSLENSACHKNAKDGSEFGNSSLAKLICLKNDNERVIGFHYLGENAGEVTSGFALSLKLGATKKDFDETVGIHPTSAEAFTTLKVKKSSGKNYEASGC